MIEAAGGVVWRRNAEGRLRILLVHRPRYDDWSLPKGKLDAGESFEAAALREVEEETGLRCRLGPALPTVRYRDGRGRAKVVRYWAMEALEGTEGTDATAPQEGAGWFVANDEVDEVAWVSLERARNTLTYPHDVEVVDALAALVAGPPEKGDQEKGDQENE